MLDFTWFKCFKFVRGSVLGFLFACYKTMEIRWAYRHP